MLGSTTVVIDSTDSAIAFQPYVGYSSVEGQYMVVAGTSYGGIRGRNVSDEGVVASSPFTIASGGLPGGIAARVGGDANAPRWMVVWGSEFPTYNIFSKAFPLVTPPTPTATPIPTATPPPIPATPPYATSHYIGLVDRATGKLDIAALYRLGRAEAIDQSQRGVTDAIVVFDFGDPLRQSTLYGTALMLYDGAQHFASTDDIEQGVEEFIKGYWENSSATMRLTVAMGTNNANFSSTNLAAGHGEQWAEMVNRVREWIRSHPCGNNDQCNFSARISAAGAIDIEKWGDSSTTEAWVNAYAQNTTARYYNYGTCEDCPQSTIPPASITSTALKSYLDYIWRVSWGVVNAYSLPEIYATSGINANQWFNLSYYAATCTDCAPAAGTTARRIYFSGTFTQWQRCQQLPPNNPNCRGTNQEPAVAWRQMFSVLNNYATTRQSTLRWSTDIKWETRVP